VPNDLTVAGVERIELGIPSTDVHGRPDNRRGACHAHLWWVTAAVCGLTQVCCPHPLAGELGGVFIAVPGSPIDGAIGLYRLGRDRRRDRAGPVLLEVWTCGRVDRRFRGVVACPCVVKLIRRPVPSGRLRLVTVRQDC
jgi:hypothetical protein